jgi:hypothetical protein
MTVGCIFSPGLIPILRHFERMVLVHIRYFEGVSEYGQRFKSILAILALKLPE